MGFALWLAASHAAAHHANSAYDRATTTRISGIVTRWQFINPHAGLWVEVEDADGREVDVRSAPD